MTRASMRRARGITHPGSKSSSSSPSLVDVDIISPSLERVSLSHASCVGPLLCKQELSIQIKVDAQGLEAVNHTQFKGEHRRALDAWCAINERIYRDGSMTISLCTGMH